MQQFYTKGYIIKAHRAMWNWIADTIEKTDHIPEKTEFKHPDYPNLKTCTHYCYLCEYADRQTHGIDYAPIMCQNCPLEWPDNYHKNLKPSLQNTNCCITKQGDGLYNKYAQAKASWQSDHEDRIKECLTLARQIANLPERK